MVAVGRPGKRLGPAIEEYEARATRYWKLDVLEVREESHRKGRSTADVRAAESDRITRRIAPDSKVVALTRRGTRWSSERLARFLGNLAVRGAAGATFLIGGAYGLGTAALDRADHRLSLSAFTMPHDLARLVLTEQLYRAGTILRNEPYHKAGS